MKKTIPTALGLLFSSISIANTALEPVKVTAKGFDSSLYTETTDINTIYINELLAAQSSLADILSDVAGIQISQYGGPSQNTTLQIDGINLKNTLVLLDGQIIGSATLGQASLNRIPVSQIEKIEILKGSGSALYGSSAMGGVINLISKREQKNISVSSGSFNTQRIDANYRTSYGKNIQTGLTANFQESEGINSRLGTYFDYSTSENKEFDRDKDGNTNKALSGFFNISPSNKLTIENSFFFNQSELEYDATGGDDQSEYKNSQINTKVKTKYNNVNLLAFASRQTDSSSNFGVNNSKETADTFTTVSHNLNLQAQIRNDNLEVITGIDWKEDDISDSELSSDYEKNTINNISAFSQASFRAHPHALISFGARVDEHSSFGDHTTYNTSLSSSFENHRITLTAETGFKAPTFNDLYYPNSGNPDLKPEESIQRSLRYSYQSSSREFSAKVYQTDLDNLIAWAPTQANPNIWQPSNINESEIKGWRLSLTEYWSDIFTSSLSATRTISKNIADNKELALTPEYSVKAKFTITSGSLLLSSSINHVGDKLNSSRSEKLDSYTLIDLSANYKFNSSLNSSLLIKNITDKDYTPNSTYSGTPRNVTLSLNYQY